MSDQMAMMSGGKPPMPGGGSATRQAIEQNRSVLNPTDASVMKSRGQMNGTTVRQFFEWFGVDVDGPVEQLEQFAKDQQNKANPLNKMSAIANTGGARPGQPPMPQGRKPAVQSQGGLGGLMTELGQ